MLLPLAIVEQSSDEKKKIQLEDTRTEKEFRKSLWYQWD